jgi:mRNA interferase MazF
MSSNHPVRGEIYWTDLKPVKGSEQGGSRPVLFVSNNLMNQTSKIALIVPMTTVGEKVKAGPFNIAYELASIDQDEAALESLGKTLENGVILCNQARAISRVRLIKKVGIFKDKSVLKSVGTALIHSFGLDSCDECGIPLRPNGLICVPCNKAYRTKCKKCFNVFDIEYKYCPMCGEGVNG